MVQVTQFILENMMIYGPWIMGLGFLISAAGLPIPITPVVVAAGAAVELYGSGSYSLFVWGFAGVVFGDFLCYGIGWLAMAPIERLSPAWLQPMWLKVRGWIDRKGGTAVFFSRWLLNSVDVPLGLAAGGARFPFKRYARSVITGRVMWLVVYGGLGFALGMQWQQFIDDMQAYQRLVFTGALVLVGFYILMGRLRKALEPQLPEV